MENKANIDKAHFLGNGKFPQNNNIHSTTFNNTIKQRKANGNGKVFVKEFNQLALKKYSKTNDSNKEKAFSWILETLNPLNHLPVISTLNKIANKTNQSLDMAQSAIGGAIYGGGPIGLAKGLGNWFINKLIPQDLLASKIISKKSESQITTNVKEIIVPKNTATNKINSSSNEISLPKNIISTSKKLDTISEDIKIKNQPKYNNFFFYYYSNEKKANNKKIDVDA